MQPMTWGTDGWLRTANGDGLPASRHRRRPLCRRTRTRVTPSERTSTTETLPSAFQWLRTPHPDDLFSLRARPGYLRLYGRETIGSLFRQALVARRQQAHCYSAVTRMEFEPEHFQQMAGLVCYYNSAKFHYLHVSRDSTGTHLRVMSALPDHVTAGRVHPANTSRGGACRSSCGWRWTSSACASLIVLGTGGLAVAAAAVRRQHPLGRGDGAGAAELHRRIRRDGVPGSGRHRTAGGLRLV
jgi:beta-xylosidase